MNQKMGLCISSNQEVQQKEINKWSKAKTYNDLIKLNLKWLNNEIKEYPMWFPASQTNNLCKESMKIIHHLNKLNKLGFLTVWSQPGDEYMRNSSDNSKIRTRACVTGCMPKHMAIQVFEKLKDKDLVLQYHDELNHHKKKNFYGYISECEYLYATSTFSSDNIQLTGISIFGSCGLICLERLVPKNITDKLRHDIFDFAIMDKQWNRNDYMWDLLIAAIEESVDKSVSTT